MTLSRFAYLVIGVTGTLFFLIIAKDLLIPIAIAGCIWYITTAIANLIAKTGLPRVLCTVLATIVNISFILIAIEIIVNNVEIMIEDAPTYQARVEELRVKILVLFKIDELPSFAQILDQVDLKPVLSNLGASLSSFAGNLVLVIIYTIFLLMEQSSFPAKWKASFSKKEQLDQATATMKRISSSVRNYISVKAGMSLLTASLSWFVMMLLGLEYAIFWSFLIFLFNFIPAIGSLVATSFPVLFSLLQFESLTNSVILLVVIAVIQFSVANLLEPRLLGRSLNISGLVVLISLSLWGAIWGIIGMILSVPIMVTLIIIFSEFPGTRAIAIWLSSDGIIGDHKTDTKSEKSD
jgi:predicted PurR-regulated permease PerM